MFRIVPTEASAFITFDKEVDVVDDVVVVVLVSVVELEKEVAFVSETPPESSAADADEPLPCADSTCLFKRDLDLSVTRHSAH